MKNYMLSIRIALLAIGFASWAPNSVYADQKEGRGQIFKQLNLTKDQKASLEKLRKSEHATMKAEFKDMKKKRRAFREALESGTTTDAQLKADFDDLQGAKTKLAQSHFEHMLAVR